MKYIIGLAFLLFEISFGHDLMWRESLRKYQIPDQYSKKQDLWQSFLDQKHLTISKKTISVEKGKWYLTKINLIKTKSNSEEIIVIIDFLGFESPIRDFYNQLISSLKEILSVNVGYKMFSEVIGFSKKDKLIIVPKDLYSNLTSSYSNDENDETEIKNMINSTTEIKDYLTCKDGAEMDMLQILSSDSQYRPINQKVAQNKFDIVCINPNAKYLHLSFLPYPFKEEIEDLTDTYALISMKKSEYPLYIVCFHELNHYRQSKKFPQLLEDTLNNRENKANSLDIYYQNQNLTPHIAYMKNSMEELQEIGFTKLSNGEKIYDLINETSFSIQKRRNIRFPYISAPTPDEKKTYKLSKKFIINMLIAPFSFAYNSLYRLRMAENRILLTK